MYVYIHTYTSYNIYTQKNFKTDDTSLRGVPPHPSSKTTDPELCFSTKGDFTPQGHLTMSGNILDCHRLGMLLVSSGQRPGMWDVGKHPTMHTTVAYNKELSTSKCQ